MIRLLMSAVLVMLCACAGMQREPASNAPLVLVAGATGGTGQHIVEQALAKGYRVRALVRDEDAARTLFGDRVRYVVGDVRKPRTLPAAVRGADYVISALGSSGRRDPENSPERVDYAGVKALAEAARKAGVRQFVLVSAMGVTRPDHPLNSELDNVLQWKLKGEEALRATGLVYTIVRPGTLTNEPGGRAGLRIMQGDPPDVVGRISREDLASVLVNVLGRSEAFGRTFEIISDPGSASVDWDSLFAALKPDVV